MMSTMIIISAAIGFVLAMWLVNYYFSEVMGARPEEYELKTELFYQLAAVDIVIWVIFFVLLFSA